MCSAFGYKAETLGGVVVSGRVRLQFGNAEMIHPHPVLLVYIAFSANLIYVENSIMLRFMGGLIWEYVAFSVPLYAGGSPNQSVEPPLCIWFPQIIIGSVVLDLFYSGDPWPSLSVPAIIWVFLILLIVCLGMIQK